MVIIGDVHGKIRMLRELLSQVAPTEPVCFVGDLIDRGEDSKAVVGLVREKGYHCVMGNHEKMAVDALLPLVQGQPSGSKEYQSFSDWVRNGGYATFSSYGLIDADKVLNVVSGKDPMPDDLKRDIIWMSELPLYLEFKDIMLQGDRHLVVSHSCIHPVWDTCDKGTEIFQETVLWGRDSIFNELDHHNGVYNIFGHTPLKSPHMTHDRAIIDTGAFATGVGSLTALQVPSMSYRQVPNVGAYGRG